MDKSQSRPILGGDINNDLECGGGQAGFFLPALERSSVRCASTCGLGPNRQELGPGVNNSLRKICGGALIFLSFGMDVLVWI